MGLGKLGSGVSSELSDRYILSRALAREAVWPGLLVRSALGSGERDGGSPGSKRKALAHPSTV